MPPRLMSLLRAIAATRIASHSTNDRADALVILHGLALHHNDRIAARLLRRRLHCEPVWEVIRLCVREDGPAPWWPNRLLGLEHALLGDRETKPPRDALPYLDVTVRLALRSSARDLSFERLPSSRRIDAPLHWIERIAADAEVVALGPNTLDLGAFRPMEVELAYRELSSALKELYADPKSTPEVRLEALGRVARSTERIIAISERLGGHPLLMFSYYFVDYMLQLLGLFIVELGPQTMSDLAIRSIRIVGSRRGHEEARAYNAFIKDCVHWAHSAKLNPARRPVAVDRFGITISSRHFHKIWRTVANRSMLTEAKNRRF